MAKGIAAKVKLIIPAGQATPAPPVGPALGQHGVKIGEFVRQFNARTQSQVGTNIPCEIFIRTDRSFTFITKSPPAADLLKAAAGLAKGSPSPKKHTEGSVTPEQVAQIARRKMPDLNAFDEEAAVRMIMGTARSMGIAVEGG